MTRLIVVARNDHFPSINHSLPPRDFLPAARGNLAPSPPRFGDGVFVFDATAGRWIVKPPGMKPGSGASAEQGHTQAAHTRPAVPRDPPAGRVPHPVVEALTVALGLTVFGLIAGVLMVLA
jgi:hypothetical protein